ncbi:hypothetical protein P3L10_032688 [Capsicum annuum]
MLSRMKRLFILSDCQSQSTIRDVLNDLKTKVELSQPDVELRLLEVFYRKIYENNIWKFAKKGLTVGNCF